MVSLKIGFSYTIPEYFHMGLLAPKIHSVYVRFGYNPNKNAPIYINDIQDVTLKILESL